MIIKIVISVNSGRFSVQTEISEIDRSSMAWNASYNYEGAIQIVKRDLFHQKYYLCAANPGASVHDAKTLRICTHVFFLEQLNLPN